MDTCHIYVISDLHLGGAPETRDRPSFQMCPPESRRRLARFIAHVGKRSLASAPDSSTVELIINGDFVDFLAEQPFESFTSSPQAAVAKLREIIKTCDEHAPASERVFPALRQFVADGHRLTLLLGNHDIELALPAVRHELSMYLTQSRPANVEFLVDGEACRRGYALIEHGNRYDGWNAVAHGSLRAFRARASRGEPAFPFAPPAGSRLVTEVMNPLKSLYRFIDLLKPENEAVIPILSALHPEAIREIRKVFTAWRAKIAVMPGEVPDEETYIAGYGADEELVPDSFTQIGDREPTRVPDRAPSPQRPPFWAELAGDAVDDKTLRRSEALLAESEALLEQLAGGDDDVVPEEYSQVGDGRLAWLRSTLSLLRMSRSDDSRRYQHLRDALVSHRQTIGTTFALQAEDPQYIEAANRLGRKDIRFVIFGHTHLAKSISLNNGGRYINTGTWCPTIRLDERLYEPGANDAEALQLLRCFVEDMGANRLDDWTTLHTPFAHIVVGSSGETTAELCEFHDDGSISSPVEDPR